MPGAEVLFHLEKDGLGIPCEAFDLDGPFWVVHIRPEGEAVAIPVLEVHPEPVLVPVAFVIGVHEAELVGAPLPFLRGEETEGLDFISLLLDFRGNHAFPRGKRGYCLSVQGERRGEHVQVPDGRLPVPFIRIAPAVHEGELPFLPGTEVAVPSFKGKIERLKEHGAFYRKDVRDRPVLKLAEEEYLPGPVRLEGWGPELVQGEGGLCAPREEAEHALLEGQELVPGAMEGKGRPFPFHEGDGVRLEVVSAPEILNGEGEGNPAIRLLQEEAPFRNPLDEEGVLPDVEDPRPLSLDLEGRLRPVPGKEEDLPCLPDVEDAALGDEGELVRGLGRHEGIPLLLAGGKKEEI